MPKSVAVILSGAGYLDGTEIQEAVLTLFFLEKEGLAPQCFAPDREQFHVVDHRTGQVTAESRNVLTEAARIARGKVRPLSELNLSEVDAIAMPGGFGVAKNLSDFAWKGAECAVDPDLLRALAQAVAKKKPVLAICIAPAVLAAALKQAGSHAATLTIGNDPATAAEISKLGARHEVCPVDRVVVDLAHRIITTPAYMFDVGPGQIGQGIELAVQKLASWLC